MSTPDQPKPSPPEAGVDALPPSSVDALFDGAVQIEQALRGYRYNVDSVLLSAFAHPIVGENILDVGASAGVVGLALAHLAPTRQVLLVERQATLATWCRRNIDRNALNDRCLVEETDIRELRGRAQHFDGAVMNPPYFRPGAGRQSPIGERALARHQVHGALDALVAATARHLYCWAPLCAVYPAEGTGELLDALFQVGRRAIELQPVLPIADHEARLVLIAARQSKSHSLNLLAPLVLHTEARDYTPEAKIILETGHWPWNAELKKRR